MNCFDTQYMQVALAEAKKAFSIGEVPVGAVLVYREKIIVRTHNLVETSQDALAHAELLCLREGARLLGNWRLIETTLYCTLEPCVLCAGGMILSRIARLVYGAPDLRHGANGSVFKVLTRPHPIHSFPITKGVCEEEARKLMQTFFQARRKRRGEKNKNGVCRKDL